MTLATGTRLGPYEILAPIGAGGMGEVYRARDTRLDRTVAIKVLPAHRVADPDFRQRFEREARAVSSLNHPHICALYDVGRQDGIDFLVMEYLEGETLAERLEKGPLPVDQVVQYTAQIAGALDHAHLRGLCHRDLKPGNVMLTKTGAKLLDFGLAKVDERATSGDLTRSLTAEGRIVGTLQYMAPEQLRGGPTDARSDLFAFGVVLYEMLTGRAPFAGTSQADLIAAILDRQPAPVSDQHSEIPAAFDPVLKRCLAKDPEERWQSARDLVWALKILSGAAPESPRPAPKERPAVSIAAATALVLLLAIAGAIYSRRSPPTQEVVRFSFPAPLGGPFASERPSVSPDGRRIAFWLADALWVRSLDSATPRAIEGTQGASYHFWSPDGQSIAFFADGKLKKVGLAGGPAQTICDMKVGLGGSWSGRGQIIFAPENRQPLSMVAAAGGIPSPITTLDSSRAENSHRFPHFLPDGRSFLYVARSAQPENSALFAKSLDSKEAKRLLPLQSPAAYAPPGSGAGGHLLFVRDGNLFAQPFDAGRLEITGEPAVVAQGVHWVPPSSFASFSVSADGRVLAYRTAGLASSQLYWFDRSGKRLASVGPPGQYSGPRLSPDGKRAVLHQPDSRTGNRDIWVLEVSSGVISRFTLHPANEMAPVWAADQSVIAFGSDRAGGFKIYQKSSSGAGDETLFTESPGSPDDWSLDNRFLVYSTTGPTATMDLWLLPLKGDRKPFPLAETEFTEADARFSPDGRWVAYASNESGRFEVYVQSVPANASAPRAKWRVSNSGGSEPKWRRDGKELFYVAPDKTVMAVEVKGATGFEAGIPQPLFKSCGYSFAYPFSNTYDDAADGRRFLINCLLEETASSPITVVVNWAAGLKK